MPILRRMAAILSANFHDLADRFEDPEKMLREAIREMEATIDDAMRRAAKMIAAGKLSADQLAEQRNQADRWRRRAELAVECGDDEGARHALRQEREIRKIVLALNDQCEATKTRTLKLRRRIDALRVKLADARRALVGVSTRSQSVAAQRRLIDATDGSERHGDSIRIERLVERVDFAEAEADALEELADEGRAADQIRRDDPEIEAELRRIKASATRTE